MSKEYTPLSAHPPIEGDEKANSTVLQMGALDHESEDVELELLKGQVDEAVVPPEKKINPYFIISLWIVMSSSVIGECRGGSSFPDVS